MRLRRPISAGSMLAALMLAACAEPSPAPAEATKPKPACGPTPLLVMDATQEWPAGLRDGGKELAALRANVAEGFAKACADGIVPATGPVDRKGRAFDRLEVTHNPNANQLMIVRGGEGPSAPMVMQDVFWTAEGAIRVPTTEDVVYELTCVMKPPSPEDMERTGDCMYD